MVIFFLLFFHATLTASQQESVDCFNTLPDELVIPIIYNLTATRVKPTDVSHMAITNKRFNTILSDPAVVETCVSIIMRTKNVDAMDAMVSLGTRCDEWWEQYLKKNRKEIFRNQMRNLLFCKYAKREQSPPAWLLPLIFIKEDFFNPNGSMGLNAMMELF